jgi:hypothetical protein
VLAAKAIIAKAAILVICVFIKKLVVDSKLSAANIARQCLLKGVIGLFNYYE